MNNNHFLVVIFLSLFVITGYAQAPTVEMVHVQGGEFMMGCTDKHSECSVNEAPAHPVKLNGFYISKYEVTQGLWQAVMGSKNPSKVVGDSLPVTRVSWYDAQTFIGKLNQLTGKKYRLPTEAEWEYAARGGQLSHNYRFSGSNEVDEVAWCKDNSDGTPQVVGTKKPNELGICDMSGNVYEWCKDGYDRYEPNYYETMVNPQGYEMSDYKVYRGGGVTSYWDVCRVSARSQSVPNAVFNYVGFRLAMDEDAGK